MRLGVCYIPTSVRQAGDFAELAEQVGVGWFGVADSPKIFGALYPSMQVALDRTSEIRVGTLVTNPVTRHWSVHASTYRAFDELHPGRSFLGIAAGDSAVHSIGLAPGTPADVAATVEAVRESVPSLPIVVAAGGPKAAAGISPAADGALVGTGFEPTAFEELSAAADAGPGRRRDRWIYAVCHLVETEAEVEAAEVAVRSAVIAFSRQALSGRIEAKHVPPDLVPGLREMYAQYVFGEHARLGSANATLLARYPREERYLIERFSLIATPDQAAARVAAFRASVGDFGLFVGTMVPDQRRHFELLGSLIERLESATAGAAT